MFSTKLLSDFQIEFPLIIEHVTKYVLHSGLLLDEHEYSVISHCESNCQLIKQLPIEEAKKQSFYDLFINSLVVIYSFITRKNDNKFYQSYYYDTTVQLIDTFIGQSKLNKSIKSHFERRSIQINSLEMENCLKECTLIRHEINFLKKYCSELYMTNQLIINSKLKILEESKMEKSEYCILQLDDIPTTLNLENLQEYFYRSSDIFIYNVSEFLNILILSFHDHYILKDAYPFEHYYMLIPDVIKPCQKHLKQGEIDFDRIIYFLELKDEAKPQTEIDTISNSNKFFTHHISEILRNIQVMFQISADLHSNFTNINNTKDDGIKLISEKITTIKSCLKKCTDNVDYVEKMFCFNLNDKVNNLELIDSSSIIKSVEEPIKIIRADDDQDLREDEVFSCFVTDDGDSAPNTTHDYNELLQSFTSQKMLIVELQEKLDALTTLKGRKIAPEPDDLLMPEKKLKENKSEVNVDTVPIEDDEVIKDFLPPPLPPKLPEFNLNFDCPTISFSTQKSIANQVKDIVFQNKREEEVFGSDCSSSEESDDN